MSAETRVWDRDEWVDGTFTTSNGRQVPVKVIGSSSRHGGRTLILTSSGDRQWVATQWVKR